MLSISPSLTTLSLVETLRGGAKTVIPPPLPEKLYADFYKLPEPLRYFISGNVGNIVFFILERLLQRSLTKNVELLPPFVVKYMDSITFFVAYFLQVVPQHWFHAFLVYGMHTISTRKRYLETLLGNYTTYMGAMVGSTFLNTALLRMGLNRTLAFPITLWLFACINFFILKYLNEKIVAATADAEEVAKRQIVQSKKAMKQTASQGRSAFRGGADFSIHDFVLSIGNSVDLMD